jgi:tetratricopeptide (TPR) repeat protein
MIERLLAADAALERDDLATAEKLFGQVAEADPRNAIAAVGLGRVAAGRDDADGARTWFRRALEIDPDEAAARRLLDALNREVPEAAVAPPMPAPSAHEIMPPVPASPRPHPASAPPLVASPPLPARERPRRSLLDRLRAWLGLGRSRRRD